MPKPDKHQSNKELMTMRNIGPKMAERLEEIGIHTISEFRQYTPDELYERLNGFLGYREDRCVLYIFRGAKHDLPWPLCSDKNFERR
ncbi:MAG: helix-hairpin-helix domain-containing protein [Nitrospirota bacterium]